MSLSGSPYRISRETHLARFIVIIAGPDTAEPRLTVSPPAHSRLLIGAILFKTAEILVIIFNDKADI